MRWIAVFAVIGLGCSKNAGTDECQRYTERTLKVARQMTALAGEDSAPRVYEIEPLANACRERLRAGNRAPAMDCALEAKDDDAIRKCLDLNIAAIPNDTVTWKSERAKGHLLMIAEGAQAAYARTASFPVGEAPLTPPSSCCAPPSYKCVWEPGAARPVWDALGFGIAEDVYFQYSYRSDGKEFTAAATGDPVCEGKSVIFEVRGELRAGAPYITRSGG